MIGIPTLWLQGFALLSVQIHVLFGGYPWTDRVAVNFGEQVPVYGKFR